jgi:hypothetical protein
VKFNLETREVSTEFFNRCLKIPPYRFWDEGTWNWWWSDKAEVLQSILARAEEPQLVMTDFGAWAGHGLRFWSKPLSFDSPFVQSYCRDHGIEMPFKYWESVDMRSFMRGKAFPDRMVEPRLEFLGAKHDALADVLHQIRILFAFLERNT